jgi:ABC-2 type transport system ATP-binding protein
MLLGRPAGDREARRHVGYLPELFRYQAWLSGREVLAAHCRLAGLSRSTWGPQIDAALHAAGISERGGDRVGGYSKGMQQRLGLAVALLGDPAVVFLDDRRRRSTRRPAGMRGIHGLAARHDHLPQLPSAEVEPVCDRVDILGHGRVVAAGPLAYLLSEHHPRIRVTGIDRPAELLAAFGALTEVDGYLEISGLDPARVPDLVATLVAAGGRVYAVEPRQATLEERFAEAVGAPPLAAPPHAWGGSADGRTAD